MSFTVWRITKRNHSQTAFDGSGARKYGGRWNSPGSALVYTAQHQSLAVLEILVHLDAPDLLDSYVLLPVELHEQLVERVDLSDLPMNWRSDSQSANLRVLGDEWVRSGRSAVLQVPSVLLPMESNFLLNPSHNEFKKLVFGEAIKFDFDSRLAR